MGILALFPYPSIFAPHMKANKTLLITAALLAATSVLIGAFGAHALKGQLSAQALGWVDTGVQYQQFHSLALLILAFMGRDSVVPGLEKAAYSFIIGVLLFSGSLYFLALTDNRSLAILTPIGGLAFVVGWGMLIWCVARSDTDFGKQNDR
jgi:uncharacterized membrane protein YgdD (TMEM256/DUF423 family)